MKRSTSLKLCISTIAVSLTCSALTEALTPTQVQQLAQGAQRDVIVILRDQMPNVPPVRRAMGARASALAAAQSSVLSVLPNIGSRKVKHFATINAFAATVSASEAAMLSAHPMVQAVVADAVIRPPVRKNVAASAAHGATAATSANAAAFCNTLEPEALQLTHTAFLDPTTPQAQQVRDGHGQLVLGTGVKVAYLADGIDPTIAGFVHQDGSPVFIDYQDFSGDPAGTPTAGGEAFGDASSIAAQDMPNNKLLTFDISKFVSAHPLPSPCNIRIRGMAPGASLVGLKVFSQINPTTTSNFVQAIEYAVVHDDVDVINESFGGNPFPDTANDPTSLANQAAVAAGVTVVVSTGDASAGTLGSPATDPFVISSGATTQFREYAQTGDGVIPLTKAGGFIDNNISGFSSSGFSQKNARTVDTVAPGDSGWALCSTNEALFLDCSNDIPPFGSTPIEVFGGTSESSPLTAGEAALVIQAYRSTHGGNDPTPATVKQIIMSTATDLGAPASEQGAGLINALAAVNAALAIQDDKGTPKPTGNGLVAAPTSAHITAQPNARESLTFTITNTGSTKQQLTPNLETLGAPFTGATLNLKLNPAVDPTFVDVVGNPRAFTTHTFNVPANADHLDAAVAFQSPLSIAATNPPVVFMALLDPSGRQAAYSVPQGAGSGYAHVDVVKPQAGTWTVVVNTFEPNLPGSYSGPVQFTWGVENFVKLGSVSPSNITLAPGAHETVTAEFAMPASPGDSAAAIRFDKSPDAASANFSEIPVTLRTLIPTGPTGGNFTGTLTGGNGRAGAGPTQTFAFDVPASVNNMTLSLEISDNGYLLEGLLVDPNGMELSVQPNQDPSNGSAQFALALSHYNPQPGRWQFVLVQNFTSSGNQTTLPFVARIGFNTAEVSAPKLPNSPGVTLSASGTPVSIPVKVTNNGALTRLYFADARLNTVTVQQLPPQACSKATTLPGACGAFALPTQVSTAVFTAQSSVPITMDVFSDVGTGVGVTGSPDLFAKTVAPNTVAAVLSEPEVPYSFWVASPSLIGPYGPAGAPTEPVSTAAFVLMQAFDSAVSADSGDEWADLTLNTNTFNPLVLAPGATGTINLTITPNASDVGKTVSGFIYVDTFDFNVFTGDETVRIPYSYTVTK